MSTTEWDPEDRVPDALRAAVADLGPGGLSDPKALGNLLSDLLPDAPRATNLLVAAAENDVAGTLNNLCATLSPDEAVTVAARSLGESRSIEAAASHWVTAQVARSLGYAVSAEPPRPPPTAAGPATAQTPTQPPPQPSWGTAAPGWSPPAPTAPPVPTAQPAAWSPPPLTSGWTAPQTPYPGSAPAGGWTGGTPTPPPGPKRSPALKIVLGVSSVIAVALIYVIVAAVAKLPPLSSGSSSSTTVAAPTTTTNPKDAQLSLDDLMPFSTKLDPAGYNVIADCAQFTPGSGFKGLVKDLNCINIPGYAGWELDGYKFDSAADYLSSFTNFNANFDASTAGNTCPPPDGSTTGKNTWIDNPYPARPDQYVECFMAPYPSNGASPSSAGQQVPVFLWNLPSQHAFFEMIVPTGVTFAQLNQWWEQHGDSGFPGDGNT